MRSATVLVPLAVFSPTASAHYIFKALILKEVETGPFQYVRKFWDIPFGQPNYRNVVDPVMLTDPVDYYACNRGAFDAAANTSIASVNAGDAFGFQAYLGDNPTPPYHQGPISAYMSKAPTGNVIEYDGSGEWFKIGELGFDMSIPINQTMHWLGQNNALIRFTIPETTPPGQYLLRMEQIYPWPNRSNTQMFVECAQVDVKGVGGGTPGPLVHLQDYISMDPAVPGLQVSERMWDTRLRDPDYKLPGPAVWSG